MLKTFEVSLDLENQTANYAFTISQNDLKTIEIIFTITQDKEPVDLTGTTTRIAILKISRKTVIQDCTLLNPTKGTFQVILDTQAYTEVGIHTAEIYVYNATQVAVTGTFTYNSRNNIYSDTTITSTNEYQAINNALLNYMTNDQAKALIDSIIATNGGVNLQNYYTKTDIDPKFSSVNSSLADMAKETVVQNSLTDTKGVFDFAHFAGQGGAVGSAPIAGVVHNYTDNFAVVQMDNVAEGNTILVLKNARNPTRSADKPIDYIGSGNFLTLYKSLYSGGVESSVYLLNVDKNAQFKWSQTTSKLAITKPDDATWAHSITATTQHVNFLNWKNGANLFFSVTNDGTKNKLNIISPNESAPTEIHWQGATGKFVQDKPEDASWAFTYTATNEHTSFINLKNGNTSFFNVGATSGTNKLNIVSLDALHATEVHWQGATAKLLQDKTDDGNWAFAMQTANSHANMLNIQNGSNPIFQVLSTQINMNLLMKLKSITTPPTATAGGIYFDGTNFKASIDGTTWKTITLP